MAHTITAAGKPIEQRNAQITRALALCLERRRANRPKNGGPEMGADKHRKRDRRSHKKFVQIFYDVAESPAFRSLSVCARAALVEVCYRYNGGNNGKISFSVREMAEHLNTGPQQANRVLIDLTDHGLLVPMAKG